ncbi:hypothetical protein [Rhodanobacter sp. B05]|jgi:hypothetical protein|uniref:hypothetical protein n=1 Tax=Rhodanobacter sp. B05 TaxID=1945859 RepID=UPI0011158F6F|nr:hypothetical protein [Rhodanobacter sp. B05]
MIDVNACWRVVAKGLIPWKANSFRVSRHGCFAGLQHDTPATLAAASADQWRSCRMMRSRSGSRIA